ncbi:type II secretion system protein GspM [Rhizobium sp. DKSPLA3]|uniref:Type II secretion system protein GspM n=1 Tax=Rhizobium quercicola TaxID=2901226 RepID=A0A9X1T188_9HYPH|nr:type II secretion system protein GspM [Rhizobium quercicola]MCD7110247.1 type II secretion system protein GspM [Rhizobium quercicola]
MTASPPRWQALRLSAILVFIGLPALFVTLAVLNALQIAEGRLSVADATRQAAMLERRLASAPALVADATPSLTLRRASRTAAIAGLQQAILDAITAAPGRIIETSASEGEVAAGEESDAIAVTTTFDIDNDGLLRLLYRLESGVPLMTVESLSIRRLAPADGASPGDDGQIRLRVEMSIGTHWTLETAPEAPVETGS